MMKKLLSLLAVLAMTTMANGAMTLVVPEVCPGTISITGDGLTPTPIDVYLLLEGPGSIEGGNMVYPGSLSFYLDLEGVADGLGMSPEDTLAAFQDFTGKPGLTDLSYANFADGAIPAAELSGTLVDGVALACDGEVVISLVTGDFSQELGSATAVPEPVTIALLGLGGLFLRRRK